MRLGFWNHFSKDGHWSISSLSSLIRIKVIIYQLQVRCYDNLSASCISLIDNAVNILERNEPT